MKTIDSTVEPGETVIQVVIAVPIVLSMLLIAVQAMLFMHSAQIASLAASKGASIAATSQGNVVEALNSVTLTAAELGAQLVGTPSSDRKRFCPSSRSYSGAHRCTIFS